MNQVYVDRDGAAEPVHHVRQHYRYVYTGPVANIRQRLMYGAP